MKKILIDCTLTGGRGPAKKVYEFASECKRLKIPYKIVCDSRLALILKEFQIDADYILDIAFSSKSETTYEKFRSLFATIDFDVLIKFGARTPGPYTARSMNKPYIIVDGGLPDTFDSYPGLYDKQTYIDASTFFITSNFPWVPNPPEFLKNVRVVYFPLSSKSRMFISELQKASRKKIIVQAQKYLTAFDAQSGYTVNLNITDDYVQPQNRTAYGAWLKETEYDQVVGFVRRFVTDCGLSQKKFNIIVDTQVARVATDIASDFPNINLVTWQKRWNYTGEILAGALADITISRAANYQPFLFALQKGNTITTAVPANGYMDEDNAAIQAQARGLTKTIEYDNPSYFNTFLAFLNSSKEQKEIAVNQAKNYADFGKKQNCIEQILTLINSL